MRLINKYPILRYNIIKSIVFFNFRIDESDRGRSLQFTMNLVHFKFLIADLHGTLNHGVSVALSELN